MLTPREVAGSVWSPVLVLLEEHWTGKDVQHGVVSSSGQDDPAVPGLGLAAQIAPQKKTKMNQGILKKRR